MAVQGRLPCTERSQPHLPDGQGVVLVILPAAVETYVNVVMVVVVRLSVIMMVMLIMIMRIMMMVRMMMRVE